MVQFDAVPDSNSASGSDRKDRKNKDKRSRERASAGVGQPPSQNGGHAIAERRSSVSKPARDFRDKPEPSPKKKKRKTSATGAIVPVEEVESSTRSPSPVIDFDGLSRPSRGTRERLEETDKQKEERLERMKGAVRTLLECVGEDPDREGLLATPERYAKAMLFFTKGYQENVRDIVNGAIFQEGHNEMVIVKDIEIFRSVSMSHCDPSTLTDR
jgi:GTP cyclohydrolase I